MRSGPCAPCCPPPPWVCCRQTVTTTTTHTTTNYPLGAGLARMYAAGYDCDNDDEFNRLLGIKAL